MLYSAMPLSLRLMPLLNRKDHVGDSIPKISTIVFKRGAKIITSNNKKPLKVLPVRV